MIKINLALRKQSEVGGETKAKQFDATSVMRRVDFDQFKELPIRKIIVPIIIGFGASYYLDSYKEEETSKLVAYLSKLNGENSKMQAELSKFKSYDSIKKTMDEDEVTIKTKLETIKTLISDRNLPVKVLVSVAKTIPKDVWLTELKMEKLETALKGNALELSQISDFMKGLRDGSLFATVDLVDTQQVKEKIGSEASNFEIKLKRR